MKNEDKKAKVMFEWAAKNNPLNYFAVLGLAKVNEVLGYEEDHNSLYLGLPEEIENEFSELVSTAYSLFEEKKYMESLTKVDEAEELLIKNSDEIKALERETEDLKRQLEEEKKENQRLKDELPESESSNELKPSVKKALAEAGPEADGSE